MAANDKDKEESSDSNSLLEAELVPPPSPSPSPSPPSSSSPSNPYLRPFPKHPIPTPTTEELIRNANAPYSAYPPPNYHHIPPPILKEKPLDKSKSQPTPAPGTTITIPTFPSIMTLHGRPTRPPRAPNKNDERCLTYCSQTAARRSQGLQPICKTICWRRLFAQDYTVRTSVDEEAHDGNEKEGKNLFGMDGRYVYFGRSRFRAKARHDGMSHRGLSEDVPVDELVDSKHPQLEYLRRFHYSTQIPIAPLPSEILSAVQTRLSAIFSPSQRIIERYLASFEAGGPQERLFSRLGEKASDGSAWDLTKKIGGKMWEAISGSGRGGDEGGGPSIQ